jgi:hypothetical protein
MVSWKDEVFEDWWPLAQAMTLVRAPIRSVAKALTADGQRAKERTGAIYEFDWIRRSSIDDVFRSIEKFTDWPTLTWALPTRGRWTVIWNNYSLCTGHKTLARWLTRFQKLETIYFYSTDKNSTQLAGTLFTRCMPDKSEDVIEREVYCCNHGSRWGFEQHGTPLPEEDLERYNARRKRERLNEAGLMDLLERLGVHPWRESTYDFGQPCFCMKNPQLYLASDPVTFAQIRARASGEPPPKEDDELHGPPDYLLKKCRAPRPNGPASLLEDGGWCGHGEETFWAYDIFCPDDNQFSVRLPDPGGPPVVNVTSRANEVTFPVYDGRSHPANVYVGSTEGPVLRSPEKCPKCGFDVFHVAVGFEVPADAQSANDTSWFALALQCVSCEFARIAYEDETA